MILHAAQQSVNCQCSIISHLCPLTPCVRRQKTGKLLSKKVNKNASVLQTPACRWPLTPSAPTSSLVLALGDRITTGDWKAPNRNICCSSTSRQQERNLPTSHSIIITAGCGQATSGTSMLPCSSDASVNLECSMAPWLNTWGLRRCMFLNLLNKMNRKHKNTLENHYHDIKSST